MPNPKVIIKKIETKQERHIGQIMNQSIFGETEFNDENTIHVIAITSYDEAIGLGSLFFDKNKNTTLRVGIVKGFHNLGYEALIEAYLERMRE